jgi:hypothetical protein
MKQAAIGAILTAILALAIILWLLGHHREEKLQYESLLLADRDVIAFHINRAGLTVARANAAQANLKMYKQSHQKDLDEVKAQLGVKEKELQTYIKGSFRVRDSGVTVVRTIHHYDSVSDEASFDIADGYLSMHGDSKMERGSPWLNVAWDYIYSDTILVATSARKKNIFAKEHYFVDAVLKNPKAQITSLHSVEIKEIKDKRFSVGPAVIYDPFTGTVRIGVGIQYALIKF